VEVGPGRGILTDILVGLSRPIYAVEKDGDLASALRKKYGGRRDIHIVHGDILAFDLREISTLHDPQNLSLIGNIPFQITSPLLDLVLIHREILVECVLMIQKEVADRLLSPPGSRAYGGLSVIVNYFTVVQHVLNVKRGSFFPVPEVDATVVRILMECPDSPRADDEDFFVEIVRTFFNWRRKQIRTTLKKHPDFFLGSEDLEELGRGLDYPITRRPEDLSVRDFVLLSNRLVAMKDSRDFPQSRRIE
jgi:16S rRNA (adenine1518-N6/adenine1519-N6)-dimethyltransferase